MSMMSGRTGEREDRVGDERVRKKGMKMRRAEKERMKMMTMARERDGGC
jgi:hypothetical protein